MAGYMESSKSTDWGTPPDLFERLNRCFGFDLDAAASDRLHLCENYFDEKIDGLKRSWQGYNCVFVNPPYGRELSEWVAKASNEARSGQRIVMLLPARTDTRWFHSYIYGKARVNIEFLKGRIKFVGANNSAPFPSMLVRFNC